MSGKHRLVPPPVISDSADRQAAWRQRRAAEGLKTVTVTVPVECVADLRVAAHTLCQDRSLRVGLLVSRITGRFAALTGRRGP